LGAENLKDRYSTADEGEDGRIKLKEDFETQVVEVWTRFNCLMIHGIVTTNELLNFIHPSIHPMALQPKSGRGLLH
jgi:hypothetical protein